jgi:putative SOS response-associated peptidase YedK
MCGAYGYSSKDENQGYERFGITPSDVSLKPRYNARPGQLLPVVVQRVTSGQFTLVLGREVIYSAKTEDEHAPTTSRELDR